MEDVIAGYVVDMIAALTVGDSTSEAYGGNEGWEKDRYVKASWIGFWSRSSYKQLTQQFFSRFMVVAQPVVLKVIFCKSGGFKKSQLKDPAVQR